MMSNRPPKVKSADRVLDILELFVGEKDSYNLTEISRLLEMPASSTYQLLQNLLSRGYVETDATGKWFRLGYKIFEIRARYMHNTSLTGEFYRIADKIVEALNETVFLGIRGGSQLIYIAEKQISQPLRFTTHLGKVLPLYATASGKILLSGLKPEEIREIYPEEDLKPIAPKTIARVTDLLTELEGVRNAEIAFNLGETVEEVHCIAGPVYDTEGNITASISVSIPTIRITDELWSKAIQEVMKGCRMLSYKVFRLN